MNTTNNDIQNKTIETKCASCIENEKKECMCIIRETSTVNNGGFIVYQDEFDYLCYGGSIITEYVKINTKFDNVKVRRSIFDSILNIKYSSMYGKCYQNNKRFVPNLKPCPLDCKGKEKSFICPFLFLDCFEHNIKVVPKKIFQKKIKIIMEQFNITFLDQNHEKEKEILESLSYFLGKDSSKLKEIFDFKKDENKNEIQGSKLENTNSKPKNTKNNKRSKEKKKKTEILLDKTSYEYNSNYTLLSPVEGKGEVLSAVLDPSKNKVYFGAQSKKIYALDGNNLKLAYMPCDGIYLCIKTGEKYKLDNNTLKAI